jgi:osomolarity two-component system response regulator SKN7
MEPSGQYPTIHPRQHLFQSPQLPPPSQLTLLAPSFSRSNTLPPIPNFPSTSQPHRFPPVAPYPNPHQTLPPLPSPPPSQHQHTWPTLHRTSSSRDEIHPSQQHHRNIRTDLSVKHEQVSSHRPSHHDLQQQQQPPVHPIKESNAEDGMPSTSDFVKKLYKMLEDQSFQQVVSWGPQGDCFVVKV